MITVELQTPIQFFNKEITQIAWRLNYPDNLMYYQMQTSDGFCLKDGNWFVPDGIVKKWKVDDSIVSNALIAAEPWNN